MKYKKKLSAVKCTLELAVTKGKSKVEACQKKIQELKHSQAQLTQRIERQDSEPDILKKELAKERKSRRYDIKTYQKVQGFLKAYKFESRRVLLAKHGDLDFSKLVKLIPNDLTRLAFEEDASRNSTSKHRIDSKVPKKYATAKRTFSEQQTDPNVVGEKSYTAAGNTLSEITPIYVIQASEGLDSALADAMLPLESGTNVDIQQIFFELMW